MVLCLSRVLILYQLQPCSGQVLWYLCTVSGCRSRNLRLPRYTGTTAIVVVRLPTAVAVPYRSYRMQVGVVLESVLSRGRSRALDRGERSEQPRRKSSGEEMRG
jgi:hypothetical protein